MKNCLFVTRSFSKFQTFQQLEKEPDLTKGETLEMSYHYLESNLFKRFLTSQQLENNVKLP